MESTSGPARTFRLTRLIPLVIIIGVIGMIVATFEQSESLRRERPQPGAPAPIDSNNLANSVG